MRKIVFILLTLSLFACNSKREPVVIVSPSGNLKATISIIEKSVYYSITAIDNGIENVVMPVSPLGLIRSDGSFFDNLRIDSVSVNREISQSYSMVSGKQKQLSFKARGVTICLSNDLNKRLNIVFRVFDEGVAFRYIFPESSENEVSMLAEQTGFSIPDSADAWISPYEPFNQYGQPGYESEYLAIKSGTPSPEKSGWAFPMLFKNGDYWLFISEAGLDGNYCGTHLNKDCGGGLYTVAFPEIDERYGNGDANPSSKLPWVMPWRYIVAGKSIDVVAESSIVYHLSEPSEIDDVSWIKPGRASWEWWSSTGGRKVKNLKEFIDLAAEMQWEYSLIDAGWENMPDGKIEDVIAYAGKKNVGITLWYNSGGRRDTSMKDEDFVMFNDDTRVKEMARIQALGVKGIKVDFFSGDKQYVIQLYLKILQDAAKYKLLVDFHGCTMPRGWSRTYPNLLTMEAVKGIECYRYNKLYPDMAAGYNTISALIRGSAGSVDYTPAAFTDQKYPHKTTWAHELALTVVYESGIIHMADKPEGYRKLPAEAQEFLKRVPAAWDETRLINAVPGELFVIARKKDGKWYVAGINGKNEAQEITFKLPESINNPVLLADGEAQSDIIIKKTEGEITNYTIKLMPRGGFVIY